MACTQGTWQRTLTVGPGWLTEAVGIHARATTVAAAAATGDGPISGGARLSVLVVPGNPGLAGFYGVFLQQLHALFGGTADVWAVSNLGHDSSSLTRGRVWCLDSQVAHKAALIRQYVLAPGCPPAIIIGHSIGSYMVLQAVKRLEEEAGSAREAELVRSQICKVLLLMPFLAADWSSTRQRVLRAAASCAPLLGGAAGLLARLPAWLQDGLVRLAQPGAEGHARACTRALLSMDGVANNFHLAQHEFRDLDAPVDWGLLRRLGRRVAVVSAPDDIWWPTRHYEEMAAAVPGIEEHFSQELDHAFCCSTRQSQLVARLVAQSVAAAGLSPAGEAQGGQQQGAAGAAPGASDMSVLLADGDDAAPADKAGAAKARAQHVLSTEPQPPPHQQQPFAQQQRHYAGATLAAACP